MAKEENEGGGFMMMFVTLSLILLAFFILLNSLAVIDNEKRKAALGSLLGSFGMLPGAEGLDDNTRETSSQQHIISNEGSLRMFNEVKSEAEILSSRLGIASDDITVQMDETTGDVKIAITERLLFSAGVSVISPRIFPLLDRVAGAARDLGARIVVIGHTDKSPSGGAYSSNWELSLKRGAVVARHLEAAGKFLTGQVMAGGAAHHQPRNDNAGDKSRASNRRVEILVKLGGDDTP